ncbi:MAG: hypothetical protein ACLFR1_15050 [Spirochaetia bacterium]
MINPNVGKKFQIPLNTAKNSAPAAAPSDKMLSQAMQSAKSASFSSPKAQPQNKPVEKKNVREKTQSSAPKNILKGVYFEPAVYEILMEMQEEGQNVSKYINRIVRKDQGL